MSIQHEKPNKGTEQQIVLKSKGFECKINPKDLKLLDTIARKYSTRIVGEEKNIKTLVCCLVSKALAAVCLAAKSAADSPGLCDIADSPTDTVGTAVDATKFCARFLPISSINWAGRVRVSVIAIL